MNQKESAQTLSLEVPPQIGRCVKCQTEIFASHPYAWCTSCNEPIPYGVNMQRRPIMYGTIKVTPGSSLFTETAKRGRN